MHDDIRYEAAKKRVAEIREFYTHIVAYLAVNGFLVALNIFLTGGFPWALFPIGGWGIGIAIHAWETYGLRGDWEERKIAELLGEKPKNATRDDLFDESAVE